MNIERTLSIIKPDAVSSNIIGKIYTRFEDNGLKIIAVKMKLLSKKEAQNFYLIHRNKPFYNDLIDFMTSCPVLIQVLEGENAVLKNREIMGSTNPNDAKKGTIRSDFAASIDKNAVHGSDSLENAKIEIAYFFSEIDIFSR